MVIVPSLKPWNRKRDVASTACAVTDVPLGACSRLRRRWLLDAAVDVAVVTPCDVLSPRLTYPTRPSAQYSPISVSLAAAMATTVGLLPLLAVDRVINGGSRVAYAEDGMEGSIIATGPLPMYVIPVVLSV